MTTFKNLDIDLHEEKYPLGNWTEISPLGKLDLIQHRIELRLPIVPSIILMEKFFSEYHL